MNKIEFPRQGYKGITNQSDLHNLYTNIVKIDFSTAWGAIKARKVIDKEIINYLQTVIDQSVLTKSPSDLRKIVDNFDNNSKKSDCQVEI